jgi:hypothetical protein
VKRKYNKANPEKVRRWGFRSAWKKLGFDPSEVENFRANRTKCEICGTKTKLTVDHCHKINKLRGVLCANCNSGLGQFKDNPTLLRKAIGYLAKFSVPRMLDKNETAA